MKFFVLQNLLNKDAEKIIDNFEINNNEFIVFVEKFNFYFLKKYFFIYKKTKPISETVLILIKLILKNLFKNFIFKKRIKNYIYIDKINSEEFIQFCKKENFKFGLLINSPIIKKNIIDSLNIPLVNIHIGHLPYYRNKYSNIRAMLENQNPAISIHLIDEYIDFGKILSIIKFPYLPYESFEILNLKTNNFRISAFITFKNYFLNHNTFSSLNVRRHKKQLRYLLPTKENLSLIDGKKNNKTYISDFKVIGMLENEIKKDYKKLIEPYLNFKTIINYHKINHYKSWWGLYCDVRFLILKLLQKKNKKVILDIGSGIGSLTNNINIANENEIHGLDIDKKKIKISSNNNFCNKLGKYINHDLNEKLPYTNEKFDIIYLANSVPGYDFEKLNKNNDKIFYEELYRILKKKGTMYISTPMGESNLYKKSNKILSKELNIKLDKFKFTKLYWGYYKNSIVLRLINFFIIRFSSSKIARYLINNNFIKNFRDMKNKNNKLFYFLIVKKK